MGNQNVRRIGYLLYTSGATLQAPCFWIDPQEFDRQPDLALCSYVLIEDRKRPMILTIAASTAFLQLKPTVLQNVRQALTVDGGSAWSETKLSGTAEYYGEKHDYALSFTPDGQFVQTFKGP